MFESEDKPLDLFSAALMVLLCAVWGGAFVAIKIGLFDMPPLAAAAIRFFLASLALLAWARLRGVPLRYGRTQTGTLALLSVLMLAVNITLYTGTSLTTSGRAAVLFYTQPVFLGLMAHRFLPGDRLTARKGLGLAVSLCGVVFLFLDGLSSGTPSGLLGDVLALGGAIAWAVQAVVTKRATGSLHPLATVAWPVFLTCPMLAVLSLLFERGRPVVFSGRAVLSLLYLAFLSAAFGFVVFASVIQRQAASRVGALLFLAPAFGVALSGLLLGEAFSGAQIAGALGVCLGVYVVNSGGTGVGFTRAGSLPDGP